MWTKEEDEYLVKATNNGMTAVDVAAILNKSVNSVRTRIYSHKNNLLDIFEQREKDRQALKKAKFVRASEVGGEIYKTKTGIIHLMMNRGV